MKKILFLSFFAFLFTISSFETHAFKVESGWTPLFTKDVTITCGEDEYFCDDLCNEKNSWVIEEEGCRDCIGNSVFLTYFFEYIGRAVLNKGQEIDPTEFFRFIKEGEFVTLTPKSIYNHVYRYNDPVLIEKFKNLCPSIGGESSTVFLSKDDVSLRIKSIDYVVCNFGMDSKIYKLEDF